MQRIRILLNLIWNEFVYGGHLLSLGAVSIVYTASVLLNTGITWDFLLIVYLGTESVYLYNRYKEFKIDFLTNPERTGHIKKYVNWIPFIVSIFFLVVLLTLLHYKKLSALIFVIALFILGFLYSEIFKNLTKRIPGFKNIFVSLMWALTIVFLVVYYSLPLNLSLFLIFIFVFLRWIVNTSIFDLKDLENDKKENLLTLAVVLGEKKLVTVLSLITIIAILPIIVGFYLRIIPVISLMLIFTTPYSFYYFKKVQDRKINTAFLYNVIIDSEFLLWSIFILISRFLYANI